jgi:NADPH-dependent 2,4-dienoyl-CoA reductase/sulfur reductase-like enzyme/rhodanese-related sulfurtransferase
LKPKKVVIVGGVAGGASAAARLRRLSEDTHIVLVERGPHVSFANCGLPYHIGGEIPDEADLLVQTPAKLRARFNLDVRVNTEAVRIDRETRHVILRDVAGGAETAEPYDALVLSTGAAPVRPPIPGIGRPGHFALRTVPDAAAINAWAVRYPSGRAVVIGGGYIGLEVAEQLVHRGMSVAIAEALPQVAAFLDPDMAAFVHDELRARGVVLHLGDGVASFEAPADGETSGASTVVLKSGARLQADMVILGMGVRPETALARDAGLEIGQTGGIQVDETLRTSDPAIWAVGDAIQVWHGVTGDPMLLPLAGPANRQGRIAADNIMGGLAMYEGTYGTGIMRVFGLTVGGTGANTRMLDAANMRHTAVHLHAGSHAGYYPGASPIAIKVLFDPDSGLVQGAQAVGRDGVDKRIDVLAVAIQSGYTVEQLAEVELGYAPPFGSAKDPVNLAGMVAANVRAGLVEPAHWHEIGERDSDRTALLDVRDEDEWRLGSIPGAIHIPLNELRARLGELPSDKEIVAFCRSGQRSYYACRILTQNGFRARNLSGAYLTWATAAGPD